MISIRFLAVLVLASMNSLMAFGQAAQVGMKAEALGSNLLRLDHVHYRPARWERDKVVETENDFPNRGGLLNVYLTNTSDKKVDLRFWQYNGHDESYWLLSHLIAWHRLMDGQLDPGESTVLEISALTKDFAPGKDFTFNFVDSSWEPCLRAKGTLREDPVAVSYIRFLPDMKEVEIHLRNSREQAVQFTNVEIIGRTVSETEWRGSELGGVGNAIARVQLAEPLPTSALVIVKVGIKTPDGERSIYAHRRAFPEFFPIGTWGGEAEHEAFLSRDHVDTQVKGGRKDDEFFGKSAAQYGLYAMVHTGEPVDVDMVRDLSGHPAVACWMLRDEPDWSTDPQVVMFCDTTVRRYDSTKPTFLNLCRNIKFFEYAQIADIPGHDHYCVSAPSSSIWPKIYGTHLEETAYYTRDLKYASEPKPIWVWSQGNHDGWSERPKRPLPTPEELSAQLVLNIGRGAKGILWFTYNKDMSDKYPETRESMRGWNRVMALLRNDLLGSEPSVLKTHAPERVDAATLVTWDKLIVCLTNLNYEIHPEAYPFTPVNDFTISLELPDWITPQAAVRVAGDGISNLSMDFDGKQATFSIQELVDGAIVVLANDAHTQQILQNEYDALLKEQQE